MLENRISHYFVKESTPQHAALAAFVTYPLQIPEIHNGLWNAHQEIYRLARQQALHDLAIDRLFNGDGSGI